MTDIQVETITPDQAKAILKDKNPSNRRIGRKQVKQYATDMKNGKWQITGDPIRFDVDGNLIDGQHRLTAIVDSGVSIQTVIVRGLDRSTQDVIDTGAKRTAGNALQIKGRIKNANQMASIARIGVAYESGALKTTKSALPAATHSEIIDWVELNEEELHKTFTQSLRLAKYTSGSVGAIQWAFFYLHQTNPVEALRFLDDLIELRSGGKGDPRATLYRTLVNLGNVPHTNRKPAFTIYSIFKAWNCVRANKEIQFIGDTAKGIEMPKVKD